MLTVDGRRGVAGYPGYIPVHLEHFAGCSGVHPRIARQPRARRSAGRIDRPRRAYLRARPRRASRPYH